MTPRSRRCFITHTEYTSITPSEKACLSVTECQAEIKKHEFQANYDRRSVQTLSEIIESQQEELHCAQAEEPQLRDQQLLHALLLQRIT